MEKKIRVTNASGIHASPSAQIVQTVMQYNATVALVYQGKVIDARSILGILSLGLAKGSEFILRAEGENAEAVIEALEKLFVNGFR
ncbi:HPr family phosphocarrier protein [Candidatus Haliotispira prima]|uniref:HPr family phosphocarrier protein n=1 Tax=Candidatus Haliotispira prima TaxID=3034016 RepID=A0ABY8MHG1_9SPIO|nr:HPr family phosphocarrier protein [Candidatus Haliotispira prima]